MVDAVVGLRSSARCLAHVHGFHLHVVLLLLLLRAPSLASAGGGPFHNFSDKGSSIILAKPQFVFIIRVEHQSLHGLLLTIVDALFLTEVIGVHRRFEAGLNFPLIFQCWIGPLADFCLRTPSIGCNLILASISSLFIHLNNWVMLCQTSQIIGNSRINGDSGLPFLSLRGHKLLPLLLVALHIWFAVVYKSRLVALVSTPSSIGRVLVAGGLCRFTLSIFLALVK